ncbi:MAG TPA: hypothetical protein VFN10_22175 [Thermoanaerobaculia bacterium]|nr:hypothetical protein [Thermoanaerobaculia bacterium]
MREQTLRDFFIGAATVHQLADDLKGSLIRRGRVTEHPIVDMSDEFHVTAHHLLKLCDAALTGQIDLVYLQAIGFCLQASNSFVWDSDEPGGDRVSEVTADWSAPQINHPLTFDNVRKWRRYLETGEYTLSRGPANKAQQRRSVALRKRNHPLCPLHCITPMNALHGPTASRT